MDIITKYNQAIERIESFHIKTFPGQPGPIFLISTTYPGVWIEHTYDGIKYGELFPGSMGAEVAKNQTLLFIRNQTEDGRLPYNVLDESIVKAKGWNRSLVNYRQIQECVSFGQLCWDAYKQLNDKEYLKEAYAAICKWDKWLCANRMTMGKGLIELFCLYDTGHDNSARLADIPNPCPDLYGTQPADAPALPILAPDMNAVFYGNRMACAQMAEELGLAAEANQWREKAANVKKRMIEMLYDEDDAFFYDVDCNGNKRKYLSISISNVFTEHVMDQEMADLVYKRHMKNPKEFWTEYPFPSMAISDPGSIKDRDGNSWGYYTQGLTALRCARWMDHYGYSSDYDHLLSKWVEAITRSDMNFSQELDPITGEMSKSSEWYSSAMLLYVYACKRLGYVK